MAYFLFASDNRQLQLLYLECILSMLNSSSPSMHQHKGFTDLIWWVDLKSNTNTRFISIKGPFPNTTRTNKPVVNHQMWAELSVDLLSVHFVPHTRFRRTSSSARTLNPVVNCHCHEVWHIRTEQKISYTFCKSLELCGIKHTVFLLSRIRCCRDPGPVW